MRTNTPSYDLTFILPGPTENVPPGGYNVVYNLAHESSLRGFRTAIVFVNDNEHFLWDLVYLFFRDRRIQIFYRILPFLDKLRRVDYDYKKLWNISLCFVKDYTEIEFTSSHVFATGWFTAKLALDFLKAQESKVYYLIQNLENEESFSGRSKEEAGKTYQYPFKKIVINRNLAERFKDDDPSFLHIGFDEEKFKRIPGIEKVSKSVLIPLRNSPFKGALVGIEALKIARDRFPEIKIVAFGDFPKIKVPDFINYHFKPSNKKLIWLYNRARIFVLPSLVEGFPVPPLEAMSCGCALITTMNGGSEEFAFEGINALTCPPNDSQALADRIVELLTNENLAERLAMNGKVTAKEHSISKMCTNFFEIIDAKVNDM